LFEQSHHQNQITAWLVARKVGKKWSPKRGREIWVVKTRATSKRPIVFTPNDRARSEVRQKKSGRPLSLLVKLCRETAKRAALYEPCSQIRADSWEEKRLRRPPFKED